jgi:hypothetical protein
MSRLHIRHFATGLELRDIDDSTHTAYGRVVPYGEVALFAEDGEVKRERFVRGALAQAARAWFRVVLYYSHADTLSNRMGYGLSLEERDDGAWSTFRLDPSAYERARDALTTTHDGLSLGFYSLSSRLAPDGVVDRVRVTVAHVAAVPEAAYAGARLLTIRNAAESPADVTGEGEPPDGSADPGAGLSAGRTPRLDTALADLAWLTASPERRALADELRRAPAGQGGAS